MSDVSGQIIIHRVLKASMMLSVGVWGLLGGSGNLISYQEGIREVRNMIVYSPVGMLEASTSYGWILSAVVHSAYAVIYGPKIIAGVLCSFSAYRMFVFRRSERKYYVGAKSIGVAGCGIAAVMLFFAFFVVAGIYLEGWKNVEFTSVPHQYAFWYFCALMLFAVFVQSSEPSADG